MSFISVLFALLLDQARPLSRGNSIHAAMRSWVSYCSRNLDAGKSLHGWLAWGLAVGLPSGLALLIYWALAYWVGWPLAVIWSALVLYASLGFRQFSFHFTEIRDALANDDDALARSLLAQWQHIDTQSWSRSDIIGRVIEFSVLAAHRHVFGVLAWFSVLAALGLGPMGAVLYRLSEFVARYWQHKSQAMAQPVSSALQTNARTAWHWIDGVPARMTVLGFAVVGNFEEAIDGWRRYAAQSGTDNDGLVLAATAGAINIQLGTVPGTGIPASAGPASGASQRPAPELAHLAILVGLVWRAVVMWVVLLALLTLARLIA
ncbi:cobalamin biosynthesis protein [Rhodoferax sp.]|jgi:adenosylcobinamide-phosphate synthase|uniref:cobalamin biosynthesis protein n=1 Tax=Rhodoferax sp. TaxID=50421 RepID=UPI0027242632|nr:cobalamin biosynthesis protein [Rhodoferax sp.]MDO9145083.1 cobalamin biosynthesis protein [Rhodoferax sp.]MDP1528773.1 cobalamin biosynthesis protein [Rhodoferax sp.]MDP1943742.1 cobalamin biosynthesis protein [Rhodoferax sp.]MDP2440821.1 cobalamin biosynthesis protein [Rhodoferax sp.]MDP3192961.1 cobalamin biosynthesis protein [Rhodoferax sp.]